MWRKTAFAGNEDSDQSISEEEDLASDWQKNCIALGGTAEREGGIQIQSQLEVLRDTHERDHGTETANFFNEKQTAFSSEDEVEIPVFHDVGGLVSSPRMASTCNLKEEIIPENEEAGLRSLGRGKQDGACTWSAVAKEADSLVHLIENARSSSLRAVTTNVHKHLKGGRGKSKTKFSFRFQSHKEDIPGSVSRKPEVTMSSKVPKELDVLDNRTVENTVDELLEGFEGGNIEESQDYGVPAEEASGHNYTKHSMAELLDIYQENTRLLQGNSKWHTSMEGRKVQLVVDRNISPLGGRDKDDDDPPEDLDTESASDDELSPQANVQNLGLIIFESKQKAMSDKFQEAFGAASTNEEGSHFPLHGIGLFGKLQRVMESEKKREVDFLKRLQIGADSKDETSCVDVKILSRCLEAKLTVCCCLLSRDKEGFQWAESLQTAKENQGTVTVMFNSRTCDDVELEVGNLIRIHSPWKEVQVGGKEEVAILSAFFSQISS